MMNFEKLYFAIVSVLIAVAVVLMINGQILGNATTGLARVLLITGICLIGTSRKTLGSLQKAQKLATSGTWKPKRGVDGHPTPFFPK